MKQSAGLIVLGAVLLLAGMLASIAIGWTEMGWMDAINALFDKTEIQEHLIVTTLRLPRVLLAAMIGASLAVAGAIMQAMTGNPLASPQTFGVNAGAALAVVAAMAMIPQLSPVLLVGVAFLGAVAGGATVFSLGSSGGMTSVKLALAGTAVHLFFSSLTEGLILFHQHSTDQVMFWLAGSIDGSDWGDVWHMLPWALSGLLVSFLMARPIRIMRLGEEVARNLGQNVEWVRLLCGMLVIVLAGSAVAVAGPIGFIGLMVPHLVRFTLGEENPLFLPLTALAGALLLVYADIVSRWIAFPYESPVGIVTALIGGPFFLYLAGKERKVPQ